MATDPDHDPKVQRLMTLVRLSEQCALEMIESAYTQVAKTLASLFALIELDESDKSTAELRKLQHNYVFDYQNFLPTLTNEEIRVHNFLVQQHLDQTYFKGWSTAKPKFGSGGGNF